MHQDHIHRPIGPSCPVSYDGLGRRIAITSTPAGSGTPATSDYLWCGTKPCQVRNGSGTVTRGYYAEGEFIQGSPGQSDYYGTDQLDSVRRVFTASQAPSYDYDPYGNPLQATAPLTDYGFAGMVYNADSGLDLARNRIYDPIIGRWLSRDPSGETADRQGNLYAYAEEDPVNEIDPSGLISQEEAAGLIAFTQAIGLGPEDPAADAISAAIEEDALADAATAEANDAEATGGEAARCLATQGERAAADSGVNALNVEAYGPGAGFSGAFNPETGDFLAYPSGDDTVLANGEAPSNLVPQYGGHAAVDQALSSLTGSSVPNLGFSVTVGEDGSLSVGFRSGVK